jgi:hypothetical protein
MHGVISKGRGFNPAILSLGRKAIAKLAPRFIHNFEADSECHAESVDYFIGISKRFRVVNPSRELASNHDRCHAVEGFRRNVITHCFSFPIGQHNCRATQAAMTGGLCGRGRYTPAMSDSVLKQQPSGPCRFGLIIRQQSESDVNIVFLSNYSNDL